MLSNELERKKEREKMKITTNLEVTVFPCCRAPPAQNAQTNLLLAFHKISGMLSNMKYDIASNLTYEMI
jgi:hypothetical protein